MIVRALVNRRFPSPYASLFLALFSTFILWSLARALPVPPLRGRVNDYAEMIGYEGSLERQLEEFENETGHQIAVLTIPSLEGEDIEGFGIRAAENWKLGKKKFDNGVILIISRDDHRVRIEVGYGLEGVLPDAIASRIIREIIVPRFRENDFAGGIEAGVEAIIKVTSGEHLPREPGSTAKTQRANPLLALGLLFPAALLAFIIGLGQPSLFHGAFIGACGGAVFAILALGAGIPVGVAILLISLAAGAYGTFYSRSRWGGSWTDRGSRRSEPWVGNTFVGGYGDGGSGSGGSSGNGGGGGFSGGGGGFGGGGASGGW
ncbi:MAG TPA: YgcG family protein [Candidatus Binatia bacterium]